MDLNKILRQLYAERERIDEAMAVLQRLSGDGKRRGRPPKWLTELKREDQTRAKGGKRRTTPSAKVRNS